MNKYQVRADPKTAFFTLSCKRSDRKKVIVIKQSKNRAELLHLKKILQKSRAFEGEIPGFMFNGL